MMVYRVERLDTGNGPYQDYEALNAVSLSVMGGRNHPSPHADGIFTDDEFALDFPELLYGFGTIGDLFAWFDADTLATLLGLGYVVATYDANCIRFGNCHLAFDEREAKLLELSDALPLDTDQTSR